MLPRRLASVVALAAAVAACAGLKSAEINIRPGLDGGGTSGDDNEETLPDGSKVKTDSGGDAGAPPDDFECDHDPWSKDEKTRPECAARTVKVVDSSVTQSTNGISIARTPAGRIAIGYNSEEFSEQGKFRVAHFIPKDARFVPAIIERAAPDFFHDGFRSRLIGAAPDTVYALTYDVSDIDQVGTVNLSKLVNGKAPFTDPDLALDAVPNPSEIGFAMDSALTAYAVVRVSTGTTTAKLVARKKPAGGLWTALPDIPDLASGLLPKEAPGAGSSWLFVDPNDQLHLLFHQNELMQFSTPRYHTLAATKWSYRKTIDNNVIDGLCGYSPRLAAFGTRKYAAYFFRKAGQATPASADLRLATWVAEEDKPEVEILDQRIPSEIAQQPRYAVAMAVDTYGLVHLAIIRPSSTNHAVLEYRRQVRIDGGGTKWLSDVVDPEIFATDATSYPVVDIIVDANARPHIAYRSALDAKIYYATRFDR